MTFLAKRHDNRGWLESDAERRERAGKPLSIRGAIVEWRGDLPERAARCCMKTTGASQGCMCCNCTRANMHHYGGVSLASIPWMARTHAQFLEGLRRQLIKVHVTTVPDRDALVGKLKMLNKHPWGRIVNRPPREDFWKISHGDRLVIGGVYFGHI